MSVRGELQPRYYFFEELQDWFAKGTMAYAFSRGTFTNIIDITCVVIALIT